MSDQQEDENVYTVEKIVDVKWEMVNGNEELRYRVRWLGFSPLSDTWEPPENFSEACEAMLADFNNAFEQLKAERLDFLQGRGQDITEAELRKVNILSREIEEIRQKRGRSPDVIYLVKWVGVDKPTWVAESDLAHAQDKVDAFLHADRVKQVQRKTKHQALDISLDSERRKREQEFYKKIEKGDVSLMQTDLYTRVKGRRLNRENPFHPNLNVSTSDGLRSPNAELSSSDNEKVMSPTGYDSAHRVKKQDLKSPEYLISPEKRRRASNEYIGSPEISTSSAEADAPGLLKQGDTSNGTTRSKSLLDDLPLFQPEKSKKEFERLEQQVLILSKEEFEAAVDRDDYQTVLASMLSENIPEVDFDHLFLKAARRGGRDVALLLSACVSDLSVRDEYGNSAICMAAELGDICFAYHLFRMNVPRNSCNGSNETLQQIASKSGHRHFIKFLREYKCENVD